MGDAISKRTTIVDIARLAGVSIKTVSRALNDEPHVSDTVRRAVKDAAVRLDYHPNIAAQSLIAKRSYLIGLTYERPSPSYVVDLQNGALERLENERYRLVVLSFGHVASRPADLGTFLLRAGLDGVLLAPPACDQPIVLDLLDRQKLPYARITPHSMLDRGIVVTMDEVAAARTIAAHVLEQGHRRIGVILGDPSHVSSHQRTEGYRRAFFDAGVTVDDALMVAGDYTYETGYAAALDMLRHSTRPTAILAQNDDMAVGAIAAARDLGLQVPHDVSIVGFDDSDVSRTAWPRLTTIHQPVREMAWDAADRLIAAVGDGADAGRRDHPHQLIVRASVTPPPAIA
ncbi:LacI family DNA-binding transcriptional regulator [Sphingomonas floccifaciens]|uniref:LacI family DNA-binding transcriptional regulator n=1 Tax=Sphingomonas floccifaciens TaxID=1844115 RepID=A0ABW4NDV2_9SPHN